MEREELKKALISFFKDLSFYQGENSDDVFDRDAEEMVEIELNKYKWIKSE